MLVLILETHASLWTLRSITSSSYGHKEISLALSNWIIASEKGETSVKNRKHIEVPGAQDSVAPGSARLWEARPARTPPRPDPSPRAPTEPCGSARCVHLWRCSRPIHTLGACVLDRNEQVSGDRKSAIREAEGTAE